MQPRYFIGLTLPDVISELISNVQKQSVSSSKLMKPIQPHITLLNPQVLSNVSPTYIIPKIQGLTKKYLPLEVNLGFLGSFDNRVLYISVDSPELIKFQAELAALLPPDIQASYLVGRKFRPHITLAQAKPKQKIAGNLQQSFDHKLASHLPASFNANQLSKFTWQAPRTYKAEPI